MTILTVNNSCESICFKKIFNSVLDSFIENYQLSRQDAIIFKSAFLNTFFEFRKNNNFLELDCIEVEFETLRNWLYYSFQYTKELLESDKMSYNKLLDLFRKELLIEK